MDSMQLLKEAGVRATQVRLRVLEALLRAGCPVSHPDLARLPELEGCDRVTLYRTLNRLRDAGLVHTVQGIDGTWRYCAYSPAGGGCPGDHPHFLCRQCGRMICLTGQKLPHVEVPAGLRVQGKQLVVYGLCGTCGRGRRTRRTSQAIRSPRPASRARTSTTAPTTAQVTQPAPENSATGL